MYAPASALTLSDPTLTNLRYRTRLRMTSLDVTLWNQRNVTRVVRATNETKESNKRNKQKKTKVRRTVVFSESASRKHSHKLSVVLLACKVSAVDDFHWRLTSMFILLPSSSGILRFYSTTFAADLQSMGRVIDRSKISRTICQRTNGCVAMQSTECWWIENSTETQKITSLCHAE